MCDTHVGGAVIQNIRRKIYLWTNNLTPTKAWSLRTSIADRMPLFERHTTENHKQDTREKTFSLRISISIHQINNPIINHKCLKNAREIQLNYVRERFPFEEYRRSHRSKDAEANVEL